MPYAAHDGVRISYEVLGNGSGPPVLLHHGFTADRREWHEFGYVDALGAANCLLLLDARGHGKSDKPHDPTAYELDRRARDVLAPGGVVGVRDSDWGSTVWWPSDPLGEHLSALLQRWQRHHGGNPHVGRQLRYLLREAGFERIASSASVAYVWLSDPTPRRWNLAETEFGRGVIALGWTDAGTLERMAAARAVMAADPDFFEARLACEAVGWRD